MKRVLSFVIGCIGFAFLWAAVGYDKPLLSSEGLLLLIGGVLLRIDGAILADADGQVWPWDSPRHQRS